MRIWVRKHKASKPSRHSGLQGYSLLPLSTQTFTSRDDILALVQEHILHDNTINTIMVEMESEYVPVLHAEEVRIIATLAALYHNANIASACKCELDLYGNPYTECTIQDVQHGHCEEQKKDRSKAGLSRTKATSSKTCVHDEWDEEMHGDQRIYDPTWEMNPDLDEPWKWGNVDTEERWGLYM